MKFANKQAAVNHLNKMIGIAQSRGISKAKIAGALAGVGLTGFSALASAAPVVLTTLTDSVDFTTVIAAILAVAAIMVGVYVAWKAAKMVIAAVKGL
jgi:hypothetical protein